MSYLRAFFVPVIALSTFMLSQLRDVIHWLYYCTVHVHVVTTTNIHWSCYCTVHAHVVIIYCNCMWSFWVETNLCKIVYIWIAVDKIQLSRKDGWGLWHINRFNPATCVFCPKPGPAFPTSCFVVIFVFSELRLEVFFFLFINIDRIVYHHCLNFLFMIKRIWI